MTHPTPRHGARWAGLLAATWALTACGGGGSSSGTDAPSTPPQAADTVPDSALASVSAYTQYVAGLSPNEHLAPLEMAARAAPTSETDAPTGVP